MTDATPSRTAPWLLSSDTHVVEPPDLYVTRVARRFRDTAPRTVDVDGIETWVLDGVHTVDVAGAYRPGDRFLEREARPVRNSYADGVESTVIEKWLGETARDGIYGAVVFPSPTMTCYALAESALVSEVFRVYNEWVRQAVEGFETRVEPVAMVNVDDIKAAVEDIQGLRAQGFGSVAIPVTPAEGHPYSSEEYEPFWAAAAETAMLLHLHVATNRRAWRSLNNRTSTVAQDINRNGYLLCIALSDIVCSGVFERHPRLRVVTVEHEAAWFAHWVQKNDWHYQYNRRKQDSFWRFADGALPSDFARRNLYVSFTEDRAAVELRDWIGVDHLMWGSDYPHPESTFPRSEALLAKMLGGVPGSDVQRLCWRNTMELYGLEQPPAQQLFTQVGN